MKTHLFSRTHNCFVAVSQTACSSTSVTSVLASRRSRRNYLGEGLRLAVMIVGAGSLFVLAPLANAASFTWDPAIDLTNSGGAGTWNTTLTNWNNGTTDVVWPNNATSIAILGGTAGGAVAVTGNLTTQGLQINTSGYTFNSTSASQFLTLVGGSGTGIVVGSAVTGTSINFTSNSFLYLGNGTVTSFTNTDLVNFNSTKVSGQNGTLVVTNSTSSGVTTLASFALNRAQNFGGTDTLGGTGNLTINSLAAEYSNGADAVETSINGTLAITNTGTVTINGNNKFFNSTGAGNLLPVTMNSVTGTLALGNNNALGGWTDTANTVASGTSLKLQSGILAAAQANISINNVTTLTGNSTIGGTNSLTLSGTFTNSGGSRTLTNTNTGTTTLSGTVYLSEGSTARTLTIANSSSTGMVISGAVANDSTNASISGLTKTGTGTLTLTGTNTYTGSTSVSAGSLFINGNDASATGAVSVTGTGTLGGSGTIGGATSFASGTTLAPGSAANTIGALTFNSTLSLSSGATASFSLNSGSGLFSSVSANGVTLGSATLSLTDLGSVAWSGATTFTLVNNISGSSISGTFLNLAEGASIVAGLNTYTISYLGGTGNDVTLTAAAVPEPSTYAALAGLCALGFVAIRRRSKCSK